MSERPFFEKLISILPRVVLNRFLRGYSDVTPASYSDRKWLEAQLISCDCRDLRKDILKYVQDML